MTAPHDSQPVASYDEKLAALGRDPLDEIERDMAAGWPDRYGPTNPGGREQDGD